MEMNIYIDNGRVLLLILISDADANTKDEVVGYLIYK